MHYRDSMSGRVHEIAEGECTSLLAARWGLPWKKIWDAPENDGLREAGRQPNVLLPGDRVHIPELEPKEVTLATEARHRVVVVGRTVTVHLLLVAGRDPLGDEPYTVEYSSTTLNGTSDGDGKIALKLPVALYEATLLLPNRRQRYTLALGRLDPADTISGATDRLCNLGDLPGDAELSTPSADSGVIAEALRSFQLAEDLEPSGELDNDTIAALKSAHGS